MRWQPQGPKTEATGSNDIRAGVWPPALIQRTAWKVDSPRLDFRFTGPLSRMGRSAGFSLQALYWPPSPRKRTRLPSISSSTTKASSPAVVE